MSIIGKNLAEGEQRLISGNVLTGHRLREDQAVGFYDDLITVVPEGRERHFIGWMLPGFGRWTYSRTYLSALIPGRKYAMHTNKNGEKRTLQSWFGLLGRVGLCAAKRGSHTSRRWQRSARGPKTKQGGKT